MLLAIDIGNTRIKVSVYEETNEIYHGVFEGRNFFDNILKIFEMFPKIEGTVLSSVGKMDSGLVALLEGKGFLNSIDQNSVVPFVNNYGTPGTLGIDRMVLAAGSVLNFPKQNRLVIDAGTCVTYDFIGADDVYLGGGISPGLRLRYESLHAYTAKLPLLEFKMPEDLVGNSTAASIHSGVVYGFISEIDGIISMYQNKFVDLTIILTGGDADFLAKYIKNTIFAKSNFLLESLRDLHLYTINHE